MDTKFTKDIISYLMARLEQDKRVNLHDSPVTINIKNDRVFLEGQVNSIIEKRAAIDTAMHVLSKLGRWYIVDQLHVKSSRPRQDHELMQAVISKLSNEPVFREYALLSKFNGHIEVQRDLDADSMAIIVIVERGCVSLAGQVQSHSHRRLAEVLMWWTEGCEYVDNQLQVVPPERDTDNEITDAVRCVLEKDPLVHASQLLVGTAGGVVMMNGSVASNEEKYLAVRDAWYVPGVADVVDQIQARG